MCGCYLTRRIKRTISKVFKARYHAYFGCSVGDQDKTRTKWLISGDLKVIALLLGQQCGYTKNPCFLCLWDSRADEQHFIKKNWPPQTESVPGSWLVGWCSQASCVLKTCGRREARSANGSFPEVPECCDAEGSAVICVCGAVKEDVRDSVGLVSASGAGF